MISAIISRLVILLFGTLYPAYASYKAVRTKNVKEYVKWMMYWIVFALFTCAETFTDVFLSFWFPFYYEIKIVIVVWLLSPATKGSSILYRNFVHPALTRREQEIDEYISKAKEQGYHTMLHLGSKGVTYATNVIMQTAIKGGGGIVNHLRRSYSLSDLADETDLKADLNRNRKLQDTVDSSDVPRDPRLRTSRKPLGSHIDLYFPEMDVDIRSHHSHEIPVSLSQIRSNEDISSGYSSAEPLYGGEIAGTEPTGNPLVRTASVGATRTRPRTTRATVTAQPKKPLTTEEFEADFGAEFGWQHPFPPIPIASLFPELCDIDPSRFPPKAFLSPEVLQYIYAGSLYNPEPCNISEPNDGRETKRKDEMPQEKLFVVTEQKDSFTETSVVTDPDNIITTENKQTDSMNPLNVNEKKSKITELEPSVNLPTEEKTTIDNNESEPSTIIHSSTNLNSDHAVTELFKKVVVLTEGLVDSNVPIQEKSDVEPKEVETNEYFEDASDVEVQGIMALNLQVRMSPSESHFAETQNGNMKPTTSLESVASSDDQGFEDSVPDVAMMSGWESPSNEDRRGKYNKARAPPPPDTKPSEEPEFFEKSQSQFSELPVQPSPSQISKTASESVENTSLSSGANKFNIQDKENLSESNFSCRNVSPTPSQSKKDSSNFSRFLPKTGMTSLFGLWGPKDEGRSTGGRKSPSSGIYYSSSSTGTTETSGYRISTPIRSDESAKSTSKMLIRQMSHSPSRKRHH